MTISAEPAPRDKDAAPVPTPNKLAHAVLRTSGNYARMLEWYQAVLNAHVVFASDSITFLTYDDEHHRIAIAQVPGLKPRDPATVGVDHLAFTYRTLDDLLANHARLKAIGIEPFCPVNHGPTTSLYYRDPDGNRIELQVDNFEDVDEAIAGMTRSFDVNPVGILFEPEQFSASLAAGVTAAELTRQDPAKILPASPELLSRLM